MRTLVPKLHANMVAKLGAHLNTLEKKIAGRKNINLESSIQEEHPEEILDKDQGRYTQEETLKKGHKDTLPRGHSPGAVGPG